MTNHPHREPQVKKMLLGIACSLLFALPVGVAMAQQYPSRPLKFIVGYPAGGSADFIARIYAENLSRRLGQTVLVDNRPGGLTNIAGDLLKQAAPDGYTLMMGTPQTIINSVFGPVPAFDPSEFTPVAMLAELPFVVASYPPYGLKSAKDIVARAKAGKATLGHAQFGAYAKLFSFALGVDLDEIPYQGGGPAVTDTLRGEVSMILSLVPVVSAHINAGKLHPVGVAASARLSALPDVPTFAEQGYPQFVTSIWMAVVGPKGLPDDVVRKLAAATAAVLEDPAYGKSLRGSGAEPLAGSPGEVAARIRAERGVWVAVARQAKSAK